MPKKIFRRMPFLVQPQASTLASNVLESLDFPSMTDTRHIFTDAQWQIIEPQLPPCKGRPAGAQRTFLNALLWIASTGSPWRDIPERFGNWNVVYRRFAYWCDKGHFERFFRVCSSPTWTR